MLCVTVTKNLKCGNVKIFYCQKLNWQIYCAYLEYLHVTQWKIHSLVSPVFHQHNDITLTSIWKLKVSVNADFIYCPGRWKNIFTLNNIKYTAGDHNRWYHVHHIVTCSLYICQDISVSKVTFYELNDRFYTQQEGDFSLCHCIQTSSGLPSLLTHDY
jgi:hypothetical protein